MAQTVRIGRNDACSCGSGKKFKKCCGPTEQRSRGQMAMVVAIGLLVVGGLVVGITAVTSGTSHTPKTNGVWSPEHGHYH